MDHFRGLRFGQGEGHGERVRIGLAAVTEAYAIIVTRKLSAAEHARAQASKEPNPIAKASMQNIQ